MSKYNKSILMNNTSNILINNYVTCIDNENNNIKNISYITYYLDTDFIDDYDNDCKISDVNIIHNNTDCYSYVKKFIILSLFCVIIFIIYESIVSV